ncbi:MAG: hypothetical protein WCO71_01335 [Pseudomonadota bacterium]
MLKLRTIALTTIMTTAVSQVAFARGHSQAASKQQKSTNNEMDKTSAPRESAFTTSGLAGYNSTTISSADGEGKTTKLKMAGPIVGIEALGGFKMGQNAKFNLGIAIVHKSLSGQYKPEGYADLVAKYNVNLTTANIIINPMWSIGSKGHLGPMLAYEKLINGDFTSTVNGTVPVHYEPSSTNATDQDNIEINATSKQKLKDWDLFHYGVRGLLDVTKNFHLGSEATIAQGTSGTRSDSNSVPSKTSSFELTALAGLSF